MATQSYIYGPQNGRIGNVVVRRWLRRNVASIHQRYVANPRTLSQRTQRVKFGLLGETLAPLNEYIKKSFEGLADSAGRFGLPITPYNYAMKENLDLQVVQITNPQNPEDNPEIDYASLVLSKGEGINVTTLAAVMITDGSRTVTVSWTDNSSADQTIGSNDTVNIAIYNSARKQAVIRINSFQRRDQSAQIQLPSNWLLGETVEVFVYTAPVDAILNYKMISPTAYVGSLTVA